MNLSKLSIGELHKQSDVTRREIEGMRLLGKTYEQSEAEIWLRRIEQEIRERSK
jgi:hypothetical protein